MSAETRLLVGFLALVLTAEPRAALGLEVIQSAAEIQVRNNHFVVHFDKNSGGALRALYDRSGALLLTESHIYTDSGLQEARFYVGSRYESNPTVKCDKRANLVVYKCEGIMRPKSEEKRSVNLVRYRIKYTLNDSNSIHISWAIMTDFDKNPESGFLAHTIQVNDFSQWFAHTQDGMVCELACGSSARTFQSAHEPLSRTAPRVGAITTKGRVLLFEGFNSTIPIQNIFFHEGNGTASFYIAILDGPTRLKIERGKWWEVEFTIRMFESPTQLWPR